MKQLALLSALALLLCTVAGCKEVKKTKAQLGGLNNKYVVEPAKQYYDHSLRPMLTSSSAQLGEVKNTAVETRTTVEQLQQELNEVKQTVASVKETATEAKQSAQQTARAAEERVERTVGYISRRAPRSQKEANQMVVENGRGFFEWLRSKMGTSRQPLIRSRTGSRGSAKTPRRNEGRRPGR